MFQQACHCMLGESRSEEDGLPFPHSSDGHDRHESHVSSLDRSEGHLLATSEPVWRRCIVCVVTLETQSMNSGTHVLVVLVWSR